MVLRVFGNRRKGEGQNGLKSVRVRIGTSAETLPRPSPDPTGSEGGREKPTEGSDETVGDGAGCMAGVKSQPAKKERIFLLFSDM